MTHPKTSPYGSWRSPITSDLIVSGAIGLDQILIDGEDIYWVELRPMEAGRCVVVQRTPDGETIDRVAAEFNARSRVHEYGGGSYTVDDGDVYFTNFSDQQIYRQRTGGQPEAVTGNPGMRYADLVVDTVRKRLLCVREDHTVPSQEPVNTLVAISFLDGVDCSVLASGNDFYASPRMSPDGTRLAWITWNHPNMPWDGTELWMAEITADGTLDRQWKVAGGEEESVFQPEWSPDGVLHFVSDRSGWWNLYCCKEDQAVCLCPSQSEFGRPQWVFGMSTYAFASATELVCSVVEQGTSRLAVYDSGTRKLQYRQTPYSEITILRASQGRIAFLGGSPREAASVVRMDLKTGVSEIVRRSSTVTIEETYLSIPKQISFPTQKGRLSHGLYYRPKNDDFEPPAGDRPPLLVKSHGGPTSATSSTLNPVIQYWTSRGFAVLDVNYGGSTGYGRAYRERLKGQWGIVDVDDCVHGALYLVERGWADGQKLAIDGGSAGGYTTLCALVFRRTFKAGASYFGVSDLEALATDTHKFESRYLDGLIGPYPERRDLYFERSPIHFSDRLSCPVILFQGLEDKIVPPSQAELMVRALSQKGLPVAYIAFEGEQHGFRRAENIKRCLDAELYFYSRIFGFDLADPVDPVPIENLEDGPPRDKHR